MPLKPVFDLVRDAREKKYALGYFESWNFESLQGVLDAAEQTHSPIIIGFNGYFMSHASRRLPERLRCYAELGKAAASGASVPCGLIFNECPRDEWVRAAMLAGFNLVMPADHEASYEDYVRRVTALTEHAHQRGVAVEAEIGQLPSGSSGEVKEDGRMTDPEVAERFVRATRVDLLAVSVGNVHVMLRGERELDLERLAPGPLAAEGARSPSRRERNDRRGRRAQAIEGAARDVAHEDCWGIGSLPHGLPAR